MALYDYTGKSMITDVNELSQETVFNHETFQNLQAAEGEYGLLTFRNCQFHRCDFSQSKFPKTRFIECEFDQCNFSLIDTYDCSFSGAVFKTCKLLGVNWSTAALAKKLAFYDCILNYGTFMGLRLPKVVFENCVCHKVYFAETDFSNGRFTGSDFLEAIFAKVNLTKADFRGAKNYMISSTVNTLAKTKFAMPEALALLYALDIELEE